MSDLPKDEKELNAAIAEATKGIRAELTEERAKRAEFEKQMKDTAAALAEIKAEKEKTATEAEKKNLEAAGKYDEALKKVEETYAKKFADLDTALKSRDAKIEELMIDGKILALAENAVNPSQAVVLMKASHQFVVKDGSVVVNTTDGKPLLDDRGAPVTIEGAYGRFMSENPHLVKPGNEQGGAGTRASGARVNTGTGDLASQIAAAEKAGNRAEVIKLKARAMSMGGPHSQRTSPGA